MTYMCPNSVALPDAFGSEPLEAKISLSLAAALAWPLSTTFDHASIMMPDEGN
jgi:hypothetical protein